LKAGLLAASSSTSFFNTVFGSSGIDDTAAQDAESPLGQDTRGDTPSDQAASMGNIGNDIHAADFVLPSRRVANHLIERLFEDATIHWIDRLEFMKWYDELWTGDHEAKDPVDERIKYANLNIMFALVYQHKQVSTAENQTLLAQTYFRRAQKLLQLSILDLNRLDLLWTLLLLLQWLQSINHVHRCTSVVGLCILIARNLGIHVPERVAALPNQRQREICRRAWHGCIMMDRITAMVAGQSLQISQCVARESPLFEPIDDEFLSIGPVDGIQPRGQPSIHLFFRAFCELHLILGDILAHSHSARRDGPAHLDINHIIHVDEELDKFARALPPQLNEEGRSHISLPYLRQNFHLHARFLHIQILLYRTFFLHATTRLERASRTPSTRFSDRVTHQGILTCVRRAEDILELISSRLFSEVNGPEIVPQWWHTVTYVHTAVTILIAAHIFPDVVSAVTSHALATSIQQGFRILDHYGRDRDPARRCKMALTVLCDRHTNLSDPDGASHVVAAAGPPGVCSHQSRPSHSDDSLEDFAWLSTNPSEFLAEAGTEAWLFGGVIGQEMGDWL